MTWASWGNGTCVVGESSVRSSVRKYPYCRPSVRVSSRTPRLVQDFSATERKKLCSKKRKNPSQRMKSQNRTPRNRGSRQRCPN
ncbi:DUF5872 domain-containing protein, partial [Petrachloros mirabilis]